MKISASNIIRIPILPFGMVNAHLRHAKALMELGAEHSIAPKDRIELSQHTRTLHK